MILDFLNWLQDTPLAVEIAQGEWWFPGLEAVHVVAAALTVGAIAMLDLRLIYAVSRRRAVTGLARETLPIVWVGFVIAAITGILLFMSNAVHYGTNAPFLIKMGLLVLAGLNMAGFHLVPWKRVEDWDRDRPPVWNARMAGALSLLAWVGIVICGRWIGFS